MKKHLPLALSIFIAFVFIQSLFFKFSGSEETVIIFNTIAVWMAGLPLLNAVSVPFGQYGGMVVGTFELIASILVFVTALRVYGALLGLGLMSGAIFFHLFTPLGVNRIVDAAGNTDGGVLFMMACGVWLSCATLVYLNRQQLMFTKPEVKFIGD